jgi:hypothetical protein
MLQEYHCIETMLNDTMDLEVRMHQDGKVEMLNDGHGVTLNNKDVKLMIDWCDAVSEKFKLYLDIEEEEKYRSE